MLWSLDTWSILTCKNESSIFRQISRNLDLQGFLLFTYNIQGNFCQKKDDVDKSTNFTFLSIQSFWFDDFLRNQSEIVVKLFFESKSVNPSVFLSICGFLDGIEFP